MHRTQPLVSVVIAARNEEKHIVKCLEAFNEQNYPQDLIEVIVADGRSTDRTRELIEEFRDKTAMRIVILDNPDQTTPPGLNRGIKRATGDLIMIYSAHARPQHDLVTLCVENLAVHPDVGGVGGRLISHGESWVANAIAAARNTPMGGGLSPYRYAQTEQYVETVPYAAYRRRVFAVCGLFDETLVRNQDNEFNARIIKNGYKLLFSPGIVSHYYGRASAGQLFRQMYQYGYWKPFEYRKDPSYFRLSDVVPAVFVLGLPFLLLAPLFAQPLASLTELVMGLYLTILLSGGVIAVMRRGLVVGVGVPFFLLLIHVAVGAGELAGFACTLTRTPVERS